MAVAALAPGTGGVDLPLAMNMTVPSAFVIAVVGHPPGRRSSTRSA